uniref:J domain-containing protein n=1 Tax=Aplanochytrium stocchinoi TaxID=215587 RepID=A0A7S3PQU4_9STRA|mmetsp:Transcript_25029/g.30564  ORF Transcript_25029/g.30564 Transcript_25029/m.30564 type:complete len:428 (-) Transcript_25029:419-1702(-)
MEWKEKGNNFFTVGNYGASIQCYSKAIEATKANAADAGNLKLEVLYSNRSAAYVKYGKAKEALEDAEESVRISPTWGKAYGRKGKALFELGRYSESLEAYEEGLAVDKTNPTLRLGMGECRTALENEQKRKEEEAKKKEEEEGEDPLASFFDEVEGLVGDKNKQQTEDKETDENKDNEKKKGPRFIVNHKEQIKDWTGTNQIERLLGPSYKWLNLNPFRVFDLPIEATEEDIKRRYKKLSQLVHPDKNKDSRADEAFDQVKRAHRKLMDEIQREVAVKTIQQCRERVERTRKRLIKKGISEEEILKKDGSLEEAIDKEIKKEFATQEYNHGKSDDMKRKYANREREKEKQEAEYWRKIKEREDLYRETRDDRVKDWQTFEQNAKKQKKFGNAYRPPQVKVEMAKRREEDKKKHKGAGIDESYKATWR